MVGARESSNGPADHPLRALAALDAQAKTMWCKKCKVAFDREVCPGGHAIFMFTSKIPDGMGRGPATGRSAMDTLAASTDVGARASTAAKGVAHLRADSRASKLVARPADVPKVRTTVPNCAARAWSGRESHPLGELVRFSFAPLDRCSWRFRSRAARAWSTLAGSVLINVCLWLTIVLTQCVAAHRSRARSRSSRTWPPRSSLLPA